MGVKNSLKSYIYVSGLRLYPKGNQVLVRIASSIGGFDTMVAEFTVSKGEIDIDDYTAMWENEITTDRELLLAWLSDHIPGGVNLKLHPVAGGQIMII